MSGRSIRWRVLLSFLVLLLGLLASLAWVLTTAYGDSAGQIAGPLFLVGVAAIAIGTPLLYVLTTPLVHSLRAMTRVAQRLAQGNLKERVERNVVAETAELASAINHMAENLERQVNLSYEERDTFGAVIRTMADALLLTDARGRIAIANPAAAALFNWNPEAIVDKTFIEAVRDHDIADIYRRAKENHRLEVGQVETGPEPRLLRVVAIPIEERGQSAVLVMVQDLTDIQRLHAVRREFVANISHELRTPLASIKATVEALQAGALDNRALAEDFLDRMNVEVNALTDMVQRLMELSRVETGEARFVLAPLDIKAAVREVAGRLESQIARHQLTFLPNIPDGLPPVLADTGAVSEVLINLLGNAVKFTPPGGKIEVSVLEDDDSLEMIVRDTGEGIASNHLPHIFERFYKVDRSRSSEGVGLGLALVKHLVQAQGGRVWAESSIGRGSTFHFTLPKA